MALKDLEGKRTGCPPGARTSSRVRRDILWAYNHLDKADAKPPSPGAVMWAECARKDPGRFLTGFCRLSRQFGVSWLPPGRGGVSVLRALQTSACTRRSRGPQQKTLRREFTSACRTDARMPMSARRAQVRHAKRADFGETFHQCRSPFSRPNHSRTAAKRRHGCDHPAARSQGVKRQQ